MITLNDLALPTPASLSVQVSPQGGTAQYNTLGHLVQDGMREKRTVDISWTRFPSAMLPQLDAVLSFSDFMTLTYPDPLKGSRSMRCRATRHSAQVYRFSSGQAVWADVKITLEEQ